MNAIQVTLLVFVLIESLSMLELYFLKDNPMFNGVGIFSGWEISKRNPEVHALVCYLVNWLAGVKMIVISLVLVLAFMVPENTMLLGTIALAVTVSSFYWRLHPMLRAADKAGQVTPQGHSKRLSIMVAGLELSLFFAIGAQMVGL